MAEKVRLTELFRPQKASRLRDSCNARRLLRVWKDEGRDRQDDASVSIDDYLEWLRRNDHRQLVELVHEHLDLSQSLESMMQGQH